MTSQEPRSACQNCYWEGPDSELGEIVDYDQRVEPGEPEPTGECPVCRCLCQPVYPLDTE